MSSRGLARAALAAVALGLVTACTEGFSDFDTSGGVHGKDSGTPGSGATDAAGSGGAALGEGGGSNGGSSGDVGSGGSANGGGAGAAGNNDAGATGGASNGGSPETDSGVSGGASGAGGAGASGGTSSGGNASGGASAGGAANCTTHIDPLNCGECGRACSTTNVESRACNVNQCTSTCSVGRANCARSASGADDGCEVDAATDSANCGGCNNRCADQNGLVCKNSLCGCSADDQCKNGSNAANLTCDTGAGLCHCGGDTCVHGEICSRQSGLCSCNGARACAAGRTCCDSPAGCVDLTNNANSCGACGRACPAGFICTAGACECRANSNCDGGGSGTCTQGLCTCGTTTCARGQRCLPDGKCG